jgi:hypothetical protein
MVVGGSVEGGTVVEGADVAGDVVGAPGCGFKIPGSADVLVTALSPAAVGAEEHPAIRTAAPKTEPNVATRSRITAS